MRLLLIEDDRPLAEGLAETLRLGGYSVDWMDSGSAGDHALGIESFDGVILDLNLPGRDGFDVLQRMRSRGDATPVLILSARDETSDRVRGLDLGADDYLSKPFEPSELEARLRAMIRRSHGIASNQLAVGSLLLDTVTRRASVAGQALDLTPREFALLEMLATRHGQVVSRAQIVSSLCAWDEDISSNALDIHIHRLRRKLEGSALALRTLRGFGYLLETADGA